MNGLPRNSQGETKTRQLAAFGLNMAAETLRGYERLSCNEIDELRQILLLLGKALAEEEDAYMKQASDAEADYFKFNGDVDRLGRLQRDADSAGMHARSSPRQSDIDKFEKLCREFMREYNRLSSLGVNKIGRDNMNRIESYYRIVSGRANSMNMGHLLR